MGFLQNFNTILNNFLESAGLWGGLLCCLLIILEPILPFLPMFVFVTINLYVFGYVLGFIISYVCAVIGCFVFYIVINKLFSKKAYKFYKDKDKLHSLVKKYKNMKLETLTTIISLPFTPAFMINLLAAISGLSLRKYIIAEIIAKLFIMAFWGFVGCNLVRCFEEPRYLIIIVVMLLFGYIVSKIISKKYDLE